MAELDMTRVFIKRYVRELLRNAGTVAGQNVRYNPPVNYNLQERQAEIRVQSLTSIPELKDSSPRRYKRTYMLTIEMAYAPATEDYDGSEETFEELIAQVEAVIETDEFLNNPDIRETVGAPDFVIEDLILEGLDYRTEPDAAVPLYFGILRYKICYNYCTGPEVDVLEELETLQTEIDRRNEDAPSVESTVTF